MVLGLMPGAGSDSGLRSGRARLGVGVKRLNRCGFIPQICDLSRVRSVTLRPLLDGPAVYLDSSGQGNGDGESTLCVPNTAWSPSLSVIHYMYVHAHSWNQPVHVWIVK